MVYLSTTSDEGSSADETTTSRREKDKKSPTSKDTVHELRSDLKRAEQTIGSFALKNAKAEERIEKLEAQLESAKRQLKETKAKLAAGEMAAEPVVVSPRSFGESDSQIHGGRKLFGVFYDTHVGRFIPHGAGQHNFQDIIMLVTSLNTTVTSIAQRLSNSITFVAVPNPPDGKLVEFGESVLGKWFTESLLHKAQQSPPKIKRIVREITIRLTLADACASLLKNWDPLDMEESETMQSFHARFQQEEGNRTSSTLWRMLTCHFYNTHSPPSRWIRILSSHFNGITKLLGWQISEDSATSLHNDLAGLADLITSLRMALSSFMPEDLEIWNVRNDLELPASAEIPFTAAYHNTHHKDKKGKKKKNKSGQLQAQAPQSPGKSAEEQKDDENVAPSLPATSEAEGSTSSSKIVIGTVALGLMVAHRVPVSENGSPAVTSTHGVPLLPPEVVYQSDLAWALKDKKDET